MSFRVAVGPQALADIQQAIDYYEEQQTGLGIDFENVLNDHLNRLEKHPFHSIRYTNIRCLPVQRFPYMVHYSVDEIEQVVRIQAVFHTALDPGKWDERQGSENE